MIKILIFFLATFSCANAVNFNCEFSNYVTYRCYAWVRNISESEDLKAVYGTHVIGKTNADVETIYINAALTYFPRKIESFFPNLKDIDFHHTKIKALNNTVLDFENLLSFRMENNFGFNIIPGSLFSRAKKLESINLVNNNISQLGEGVFNGLINLKSITIYSNEIKELDENVFNGLISLTNIQLTRNKIERLPPKLFAGLQKLTTISFSDNNIKHVGEGLLNDLPLLKNIYFSENYCVNQHFYEIKLFNEFVRTNCTDIEQRATTIPSPTCGDISEVICDLQVQNANMELKVDGLKAKLYQITDAISKKINI